MNQFPQGLLYRMISAGPRQKRKPTIGQNEVFLLAYSQFTPLTATNSNQIRLPSPVCLSPKLQKTSWSAPPALVSHRVEKFVDPDADFWLAIVGIWSPRFYPPYMM
ncbi:hypothetical protein RSAG8_05411, partial [Rhizoctonia solani AG-8 WAC10335]